MEPFYFKKGEENKAETQERDDLATLKMRRLRINE